jgi:hypothetical protein
MRVAGVCGVVTEIAVFIRAVLLPRFAPSKSGDCILLTSIVFDMNPNHIFAAYCSKHYLKCQITPQS